MPTIKVIIRGKEVEISLTMAELLQILSESGEEWQSMTVQTKTANLVNKSKEEVQAKASAELRTLLSAQTDARLVADEQVKQYLLSLPDYTHTLFGVQEHFYNQRFVSRGDTKRMYHKTFHQLREIRKQIENEQGGKFKLYVGENRVNTYVFQKEPTNKFEKAFTQ